MHTLGRALAALVALASVGCVKLDSYSCAQSSQCQNGEVLGTCEVGGLCSFPDPMCPSGKKFGELAGDQSGQCVGDGNGGSSSSTTASPTTSTTFDPPTSSTGSPGDGTTFDTTATSGLGATTSTSDPTSTTVTSDPGATTEPDTTTGPSCSEVGESCVNVECCGPCTTCQDGVCMPASAEEAPALCGGECSACSGDGQCVVAQPGTPCTANCKDIVWFPKIEGSRTTCLAYEDAPASSTCNKLGNCQRPGPDSCDPPGADGGIALVECDSVCLLSPDLCTPGNAASAVTLGTYCGTDVETPDCQTSCTPDMMALDSAYCDLNGSCAEQEIEPCNGYYCNPDMKACLNSCEDNTECVSGICEAPKCL